MLGLAPPNTGTVTLFGEPAADAVRAGRVAAMLQDAGFVPGATVRDVVELARALYPHPLDTDRILATAGMADLANRRVDRLSAGETQRARVTFALAGNPDLLVLDEPTTAMDVAARQQFWTAIRAYAADGHTVLFSTHQLHEADDVADRIVVLAAGRIVADGTPAQIRALAGVDSVGQVGCRVPRPDRRPPGHCWAGDHDHRDGALMRAYLRFELRRLVRDPRLMFFSVIGPVATYLIFSGWSAGDRLEGLAAPVAIMIGLAGYGAVAGMLMVGSAVSQERAAGWLHQLRVTPVPPAQVVAVKALLGSMTAIPPVIAVGIAAAIQHHVELAPAGGSRCCY